MQDSHLEDHPGPAHPRVTARMGRSSHITRVAPILRNTVTLVALRMGLDIATGVGTGREIGVGREAYRYPAAFPTSTVEVRFL